jgi:leucyl aminopeptidase
MKILFQKIDNISQIGSSDLLLFLAEECVSGILKEKEGVKNSLGGELQKSIKSLDFKGKSGEIVFAKTKSYFDTVILCGLGKRAEVSASKLEITGYNTLNFLKANKIKEITCLFGAKLNKESVVYMDKLDYDLYLSLIYGISTGTYSFNKYLTGEKLKANENPVKSVTFATDDVKKLQKSFDEKELVKENVFFCRDLINEPANVIYPESFATICKDFEKLGVEVEILKLKELEKFGMGSLLAVGQGSDRESRMVILKWNGGSKTAKPLAFVGKGVTFDSGGLSLKPANAMETMKCDMSGAAVVASLIRLLAMRKAKVNVVGVMPLVENMPSGKAIREGDIVKSMSGQTIEILNTDAEGRLILADALYYVASKLNPQLIIDLATLTGAICIALGERYAGLFSNNDELSEELTGSGKKVSENVWRMPLSKLGGFYDKHVDSNIADVKNVGNGRDGGAITAAQFLQRFIDKHPKWAHIDIAATAFVDGDNFLTKKYATGFGVRLLNELIKSNYEK